MTYSGNNQEILDQAYAELMKELPAPVARVLARLRSPHMRWVRVSTGVFFVVGGCFAFLPVLGLELLPLGLLLLAQDVHFLRAPTARGMLWLVAQWRALKQRACGTSLSEWSFKR
jgi:hypothetical protein